LNINNSNNHNFNIASIFDEIAAKRDFWIDKNKFFYQEDWRYMRFLIPEGARVLEIGCGTGRLLAEMKPRHGVGIDFSSKMIEIAKENYPDLDFYCADAEDLATYTNIAETFDYVIISDTIGLFSDCFAVLEGIKSVMDNSSRLIVGYYGQHWNAILRMSERIQLKMCDPDQNWLPTAEIKSLLYLVDFEIVSHEWRILWPKSTLGLGVLLNRYVGTLPLIRRLGLRNYSMARLIKEKPSESLSATVVVPCRNEKGNIESAVTRLPKFCKDLEICFVEGHSSDGTFEECERVKAAYPDIDISVMKQPGKGKGDAVRAAFEAAKGEVLIILDADLTVPPEDIPRFYDMINLGKGEFVNGTRMIYPMENQAMRLLNLWANWVFARVFSYLLNQHFTDTLCGTKVLRKKHYKLIAENRSYFGNFDPFGDFDLIFGAAKLNLKTIEIPIRYRNRNYGSTQISRFQHGWLLLKMVVFAYRKMKAF
jgi:ubiquinone/menaquinone biosynthesis C-methylase UbiE